MFGEKAHLGMKRHLLVKKIKPVAMGLIQNYIINLKMAALCRGLS